MGTATQTHPDALNTELPQGIIALRRQVDGLLADARRPEVTIAFCGHFNSGKSSLLNYLVGRSLLPVSPLQETGVAHWLRPGACDKGRRVSLSGEVAAIACDTSAVAAATSLYDPTGERRRHEQMPARLELELEHTAIPAGVTWVDSPGINDGGEMDSVALKTALQADLLVWLLNTRQCFSEPEVNFLRRLVELRGPQPIHFVLNVFLDEDNTACWAEFQRRELPAHLGRIARCAAELGLDERPPLILSVRAAQSHGDRFGGNELRTWIQGIRTSSHPYIASSRAARLQVIAKSHLSALAPKIAKAQEKLRTAEQQTQEFNEGVELRCRFFKAARRQVTSALDSMAAQARQIGQSVAEEITVNTLVRDSRYERRLNQGLQSLDHPQKLCNEIDREIEKRGLPALAYATRRRLLSQLSPPEISVTVSNVPYDASVIAKATVAGAAGGSFLPGLGTLIGGIGGYFAGQTLAIKAKLETDAKETRLCLERAGREAADCLLGKTDDILAILEHYCVSNTPKMPRGPDRSELDSLVAMRTECSKLSLVTTVNYT